MSLKNNTHIASMTHIELEISNPGNERCVHCYRVCEGTKRGFLSAAQARSVLEQAKALGAAGFPLITVVPIVAFATFPN